MHFLLAQISSDPITREIERAQRNYEFLSYGLIAAWMILVIYLFLMLGRERKLRREIASLKAMLEEKQR